MPAHIPPYAGIYFEYFDRPQWFPQVYLSSVTKLHHTASRTLLTQVFVNPSTVSPISSAKYTFPLYESCAIVVFRCYVGKQLIEGIIKEKEDASATFQAAVERNEPASLLEQHTTDVFSTSIGNIPAGETVKVEIEYIMELKHDAEVDGLRFTIPTSIAPRYGGLPSGLSEGDVSGAAIARSMNISVKISMSSNINSVQSPSHPISLHLGGHSTDTPDVAFNPQHAYVTLGQTTTELGNDFILLIKCANLSSPAALLEVHPTIPNSKALMVTLVPKFNLPKSSKPEVVFVVDRSGSMYDRVAPLRSSLSVFLKSLPLDVNFNICSFGSHHSFLWDRSRPYSNQSFAEAQSYCDRMGADFGGTEILPAIKSTVEKRLQDLNLEIMLLTDGQVWNTADLFKYVEKETEKGDVRLFSLGIGWNVSHALVDGLARVGRGFSQVVSNEREGMESKVARMLRGALSPHVVNYRLEWEGKPSTEAVKKSSSPITRAARRISLFNTRANADSPVSFSDSPDFTIPSVIQAPYKIQPLFSFSRSSAYVLLSSDVRPPSHVWLRGTTPEGDELELEIAVQMFPVKGETIHQLAARKILQELKDGTSYVHGAVDKERQPGLLAEWVKKEGVRVGLKYGVASHWTSFVAVERKVEEEERRNQGVVVESPPIRTDDDEDDWDTVIEAARDSDDEMDGRSHGRLPAVPFGSQDAGDQTRNQGGGFSVPVMMVMAPPPPPIPYPTKKDSYYSKGDISKLGTFDRLFSHSSKVSAVSRGSVTPPPATVTAQKLPTPTSESSNPSPFIVNQPTGKGGKREGNTKLGLGFSPALSMQQQQLTMGPAASAPNSLSPPRRRHFLPSLSRFTPGSSFSGSAPPSNTPVGATPGPTSGTFALANNSVLVPASDSVSVKKQQMWPSASGSDLFSSAQYASLSPPSMPSYLSGSSSFFGPVPLSDPFVGAAAAPGAAFGVFDSNPVSAPAPHSVSARRMAVLPCSFSPSSPRYSPGPLPSASRHTSTSSSFFGPVAASAPLRFGRRGSSMKNNSVPVPPADPVFGGQQHSGSPLVQESFEQSASSFLPSSSKMFSTSISYSPSSAPPPERLSADTGAQPLSSKTKTLIDLQTFEGCFVFDLALATLLGVPILVLEASFRRFVPGNAALSLEHGKKLWATVLAVKFFETKLAAERSVWQLVVDKAKVWMGSLAEVGVEDIAQLEKMAGEVLGV